MGRQARAIRPPALQKGPPEVVSMLLKGFAKGGRSWRLLRSQAALHWLADGNGVHKSPNQKADTWAIDEHRLQDRRSSWVPRESIPLEILPQGEMCVSCARHAVLLKHQDAEGLHVPAKNDIRKLGAEWQIWLEDTEEWLQRSIAATCWPKVNAIRVKIRV